MEKLQLKDFAESLKPRTRDAHKGNFGHVLIVGGDYGFSGAVRLAGEAALRVGAGLVSIATHPDHALFLNAARPELMCHGVAAPAGLKPLLSKANVVVVGPGIGQSTWSRSLLDFVLKNTTTPLVVDADGLNLLAKKPAKKDNWILTPHPGEASRLLRTTTEAIQNDRAKAATQIQKKFSGVCVLKGAGTLVVDQNSGFICQAGNPGLATAGTGDVLSGVLGGLLAQGLPLLVAAKLGVLIHAMAGDLAAKEGGERGMIASDLMQFLRELVNQ